MRTGLERIHIRQKIERRMNKIIILIEKQKEIMINIEELFEAL